MSYEIYQYIFYGGTILAVLMLITTVLLFVLLKIPRVIGDLTGANARKAIEKIKNQTETSESGSESFYFNGQRHKLTDKISPSGRILSNHNEDTGVVMNTAKISAKDLSGSNETTVLSLDNNETTVLDSSLNSQETIVLNQEISQSVFEIEYEITFIHTQEFIA